MAVLVLGLLLLSMAGYSSAGGFCVCKQASDAVLQKALDYACGAGADCNPLKPNGQCYNPNDLRSHCSYAVNSYYQKKASSGATCDFNGAATLSSTDPSSGSCSFSASSGSSGTGSGTGTSGPITTVPTTSPSGTGTNPMTPGSGTTNPTVGTAPGTTTSPYSTTPGAGTPSGGMFGGVGTGLAPTGSSMDDSSHGIKLKTSILATLMISAIICLWN